MSLRNDVPGRHREIPSGGNQQLSGGNCVGVFVGDVAGGADVDLLDMHGTSALYQNLSNGDIIPGKFTGVVGATTSAAGLVELMAG